MQRYGSLLLRVGYSFLILGVFCLSATAQKKGGKVKIGNQRTEYQVTAADDVRVRVANPPPQFDDKGKLKRYSQDELKKMKGDEPNEQKLAGYKGDFASLQDGDIVQITLSPAKSTKEKSSRVPAAQLTGMITNLDAKSFSLQVSTPTLQLAGTPNNPGNSGKQIVDSEALQVSMILLITPNPNPLPRVGKDREKKKP